jgi:uncharacterized DUF497 family protein
MIFERGTRKSAANLLKWGISFAEADTNLVQLEPAAANSFSKEKTVK